MERFGAKLPAAPGDELGKLRKPFACRVLVANPVPVRGFSTRVFPERGRHVGSQAVPPAFGDRIEALPARALVLEHIATEQTFTEQTFPHAAPPGPIALVDVDSLDPSQRRPMTLPPYLQPISGLLGLTVFRADMIDHSPGPLIRGPHSSGRFENEPKRSRW